MKLTLVDIKKVFSDVLQKKISFEEASNWASKIMQLDDSEELEYDSEDSSKLFSGLTYLAGIDLMYPPGTYLHSMHNVENEYKDLFVNDLTTFEIIAKTFIEEWDPLYLNGSSDAKIEYQPYFIKIYDLLSGSKSKKALFDYLWWLETEHMGLKGNKKKTEEFTERLFYLTFDYFH